MGNFLKSAVKILALAAHALIVSISNPPQPATPVKPIAEKPVPAYIEITQPCVTEDPNTLCFETEQGTVLIYRDSRVILP